MNPRDITDRASELLHYDRAEAHGDFNLGFARTAQIWSAIIGVDVTPHQVALCMVGIKIARSTMNPSHHDNFVDIAGYAGIAGVLASSKETSS